MEQRSQLKAYTLAIILSVALSSCATDRRCGAGGCSSDEKITENVRTLLDEHHDLAPPAEIRVQTVDRVVYLTGTVSAGLQRDAIADLARQAPGVSRVVNSISISR
jgi:osmotically-inducible protein OsmY